MKQNQFAVNMPVPTKKMLSSPIHTWICTTKLRDARNWHCWQCGCFRCSPWISLKKNPHDFEDRIVSKNHSCQTILLFMLSMHRFMMLLLPCHGHYVKSLWTSSTASSFYILFRVMVIRMKNSQKRAGTPLWRSLIWKCDKNFHLKKRILKSIKWVKEQNPIWW